MKHVNFKQFLETMDIFGFTKTKNEEKPEDSEPIYRFDIELMMQFLASKKVGLHEANYSGFMSEIIWGQNPGAIKLEIDTGYTFLIKKMNYDLSGNKCWVPKKTFQLNRNGAAGLEELVAAEIYEHITYFDKTLLDYPKREYNQLENLTLYISSLMQRSARPIFFWRGIKKVNENEYQIIFEGGTTGLIGPKKLEQNVTSVKFIKEDGVIKINNYNIESDNGRRSYNIAPSDLDLTFFPTQEKEEIGDCIVVFFKYY